MFVLIGLFAVVGGVLGLIQRARHGATTRPGLMRPPVRTEDTDPDPPPDA
jgi:hypothetical protein